MVRTLGLHLVGQEVAYALLEKISGKAPEILVAGRVLLKELPALHGRLSGERPLPWGLAQEPEEAGGKPKSPSPASRSHGGVIAGLRSLPRNWPLRRPPTRALMHGAFAASLWEWTQGRLSEHDCFLWLRPERLHWNFGEPGHGAFGSVPRRGPLKETLNRLPLPKSKRPPPAVALALDGDAPGAQLLREELEAAGLDVRLLARGAEEKGADRAAAGAAIAVLDPIRPGVYSPRQSKPKEPWFWTASVLAAMAAVGGSAWLQAGQSEPEFHPSPPSDPGLESQLPEPPPDPIRGLRQPQDLLRLIQRRQALAEILRQWPHRLQSHGLQEWEMLAVPESSHLRLRFQLLPGGLAESDQEQPPDQDPAAPAPDRPQANFQDPEFWRQIDRQFRLHSAQPGPGGSWQIQGEWQAQEGVPTEREPMVEPTEERNP
ncbi:MAG: hypothetical protein DWQ01_13840 [Planctomycetota bacterium]|nr:MAG: hypothetical protein DWQ01_13840 [Planctomycetota bacterium]